MIYEQVKLNACNVISRMMLIEFSLLFFNRGANRSDDTNIPARDQMSLLQVRSVGQHWNHRRPVHTATQHCQRENIHFHMVLVSNFRRPNGSRDLVSFDHHSVSSCSRLLAQFTIQAWLVGPFAHDRKEILNWRLVLGWVQVRVMLIV